jgi:hypothetical protein
MTEDRIERVLRLVEGFESAYAMELLATVHWVATNEAARGADDPDEVTRLVSQWNHRKKTMFGHDHVATAWRHLRDEGWLDTYVPA